jgi:hypothetical protein
MIHKSSHKTGIADYFAVLGIPSFHDNDTSFQEEGNTPRSSANLSTFAAVSSPNSKREEEEERMHRERFHREIVRLALLSSDDTDEEWTICQSTMNEKLHLYGVPLHISGVECNTVEMAYQRREQYLQEHVSCDEADASNIEYYSSAVADISIHYVKVHPLSIPNYTYKSQPQQHDVNNEPMEQPNKSLPLPTTAVAVAKNLSSFARRTTGLGREIVGEGLVNVVKGVRGAASGNNIDSSFVGGGNNSSVERIEKNDTQHYLHDITTEEAIGNNTSFEDANSEMPQWKESSLRGSGVRRHFFPDTPAPKYASHESHNSNNRHNQMLHQQLSEMLPIPSGYDEWIIPSFCRTLHLPTSHQLKQMQQNLLTAANSSSQSSILLDRTQILPSPIGKRGRSSPSSMGVEAMYISPLSSPSAGKNDLDPKSLDMSPDPRVLPTLAAWNTVPTLNNTDASGDYVYIPILAVRRQRVGEEECYHEDPAVVDIQLSRIDSNGPSMPQEEEEEEDNTQPMMQHGVHPNILKKSPWTTFPNPPSRHRNSHPIVLLRKNIPRGICDTPFLTRVLDRFPQKNYRDMPFPEEELPMFCYAGGSRLVRDKLRNLPVPRSFGFVVKNERGDSIYGEGGVDHVILDCLPLYSLLFSQCYWSVKFHVFPSWSH